MVHQSCLLCDCDITFVFNVIKFNIRYFFLLLFHYCTVCCATTDGEIKVFIMSCSSLRHTARVNEGSHGFTCHPHVYPQVERTISGFTPQPATERHRTLASAQFPVQLRLGSRFCRWPVDSATLHGLFAKFTWCHYHES